MLVPVKHQVMPTGELAEGMIEKLLHESVTVGVTSQLLYFMTLSRVDIYTVVKGASGLS